MVFSGPSSILLGFPERVEGGGLRDKVFKTHDEIIRALLLIKYIFFCY